MDRAIITEADGAVSAGVFLPFTGLGLSSLWLWIGFFSLGLFPNSSTLTEASLPLPCICGGLFFCAFALTLGLEAMFANQLSRITKHVQLLTTIGASLATLAFLAASFPSGIFSTIFAIAASFCGGITAGLLLISWSRILCSVEPLPAMIVLCLSSVVGYGAFCLASTMHFLALAITLTFAHCVSCLCAFYIGSVTKEPSFVSKEESARRFGLLPKLSIANLIYGVVFGYSLGCLLLTSRLENMPGCISGALAILVGSGALAAAIIARKRYISFPVMQRVTFSLGAILLVLQVFTTDIGAFFNALLLTVVLFLYGLNNLNVLVAIAIKEKLNPTYHVSGGFWPYILGAGLGLLGASAAISAGIMDSSERTFIALGLVVVMVLSTAINMFARDSITASPESDLALGAVREPDYESLCERFRLSAREREVFAYLVRGRDARYIQEKLVISKHTVKTHIHHIYQKTGVRSQQELIDLTER